MSSDFLRLIYTKNIFEHLWVLLDVYFSSIAVALYCLIDAHLPKAMSLLSFCVPLHTAPF